MMKIFKKNTQYKLRIYIIRWIWTEDQHGLCHSADGKHFFYSNQIDSLTFAIWIQLNHWLTKQITQIDQLKIVTWNWIDAKSPTTPNRSFVCVTSANPMNGELARPKVFILLRSNNCYRITIDATMNIEAIKSSPKYVIKSYKWKCQPHRIQ